MAVDILREYYSIVESSDLLTDMQKYYLFSRYKNVEGIIQKDQGKLEICIETFLESLDYENKLGTHAADEHRTSIFNNIGNVYRNLQKFDEAIMYYQKALLTANSDKYQLLRIYGNMGQTYKILKKDELALEYFQKSLAYAIEIGDKRNECIGLEHMGNYYICVHEYQKALPYLEKALKIAEDIELILAKISIYYDYGSIAFHNQDYSEAEHYWKWSLEKSIENSYQKGRILAEHALFCINQ